MTHSYTCSFLIKQKLIQNDVCVSFRPCIDFLPNRIFPSGHSARFDVWLFQITLAMHAVGTLTFQSINCYTYRRVIKSIGHMVKSRSRKFCDITTALIELVAFFGYL